MIAISSDPVEALRADEDDFLRLLLLVDPKAEYTKSRGYHEVRRLLVDVDCWHYARFDATVARLVEKHRLFVSRSKKTVSLSPIIDDKRKRRLGSCVYCGRESKLTHDHIRPKRQGGSDRSHNIALACRICNESKGDRTPEQWAADILRYRRHTSTSKPALTLRSWAIRLALAVTVLVGKGGAS